MISETLGCLLVIVIIMKTVLDWGDVRQGIARRGNAVLAVLRATTGDPAPALLVPWAPCQVDGCPSFLPASGHPSSIIHHPASQHSATGKQRLVCLHPRVTRSSIPSIHTHLLLLHHHRYHPSTHPRLSHPLSPPWATRRPTSTARPQGMVTGPTSDAPAVSADRTTYASPCRSATPTSHPSLPTQTLPLDARAPRAGAAPSSSPT